MAASSLNLEKHTSRNPVIRLVMRRFNSKVAGLAASASPKTVLDIGCGEGFTTRFIADRLPRAKITALDPDERAIAYAKAHSRRPNITYGSGDIFRLNGSYDLVVCNEVLEHLDECQKALDSLFRASKHYVLVSVPNEPLSRIVNFLRGRHVRRLGNPEGHINHWTRRSLRNLFSGRCKKMKVDTSTFWNMVLAEK